MRLNLVFDESGIYVGEDKDLKGKSFEVMFPSLNWSDVLSCGNGRLGDIQIIRTSIRDEIFFICMCDEISRISAGPSLKGSWHDMKILIEAMPFGVVVVDAKKKVRLMNKVALNLAGYDSMKCFMKRDVTCQHSFCPAPEGKCPIWDEGCLFDCTERPFILRDGSEIRVLKSALPLTIEGESVIVEGVIDLRPQKEAERLAMIDSLTGLYNRKGLTRWMEDCSNEGEYCLMTLDVDDFKMINDAFGHLAGDLILKEIALFLRKIVPDECLLARWGGDEFLVIAPHNKELVQFLRDKVDDAFWESESFGYRPNLSVSISKGVAFKSPSNDWKSVFHEADHKMYDSKRRFR